MSEVMDTHMPQPRLCQAAVKHPCADVLLLPSFCRTFTPILKTPSDGKRRKKGQCHPAAAPGLR